MYYLSPEYPLAATLVTNMTFQGFALNVLIAPKTTLHEKRAMCYLVSVRVHAWVASCHIMEFSVNHSVKVFWMCPSHLATIAETDRGAVGQSRVGVLNELS